MQYCSRMQRQARATATDPAHLSPSRGDTLPTASKPLPPLDWPSALGDEASGTSSGSVLSSIVGTWSVDAASGSGAAAPEAQAVPQVYRLLEAVGNRGASAATSDSDE
jgi:hypothetical protein